VRIPISRYRLVARERRRTATLNPATRRTMPTTARSIRDREVSVASSPGLYMN